jgi:uncharacterized protein HemY
VSINLAVALINSKEYAKARKICEQALPRIEDPEMRKTVEGYLKLVDEQLEPAGE